jgi:hypothetical protein
VVGCGAEDANVIGEGRQQGERGPALPDGRGPFGLGTNKTPKYLCQVHLDGVLGTFHSRE